MVKHFEVEFWWYGNDGEEHSNSCLFLNEREVNEFIAEVTSGIARYDGYAIEACYFQGEEYERRR